MYRRTHKVEIYIANEGSGLAFFSTDLGNIFRSYVGNEIGVMLRGKGPHKPEFAYDIVRIHSFMIYTDLIECNIVGNTKVLLLHCSLFISKLKSEYIITTGQYLKYQTSSNLQFRPLLENSFHSIHIDLRDTIGEKIPVVSVGITRLFLMLRKASNIRFNSKSLSRQVEIPFYRDVGRQLGRGFGALEQYFGRTAKRAVADLLELAVPEIAEVVSDRKIFKTAAASEGRQVSRNQLNSGSGRRTASRFIRTKSAQQINRRGVTF